MSELLNVIVNNVTAIASSKTTITVIGVIAVFGLIHYLIFRERWNEIFEPVYLIVIAIGFFAVHVMVGFWISPIDTQTPAERIILSILFGIFGIIATVTLISCWLKCQNVLEVILFPFIVFGLIAFFAVTLALALLGFAALMRDDD